MWLMWVRWEVYCDHDYDYGCDYDCDYDYGFDCDYDHGYVYDYNGDSSRGRFSKWVIDTLNLNPKP